MTGRQRKSLHRLLVDLFTIDDLRRFLRHHDVLEHLDATLPVNTSAEATVAALVEQLESQGLLDDAFFDALAMERPHRAFEIERVARGTGGSSMPLGARVGRPLELIIVAAATLAGLFVGAGLAVVAGSRGDPTPELKVEVRHSAGPRISEICDDSHLDHELEFIVTFENTTDESIGPTVWIIGPVGVHVNDIEAKVVGQSRLGAYTYLEPKLSSRRNYKFGRGLWVQLAPSKSISVVVRICRNGSQSPYSQFLRVLPIAGGKQPTLEVHYRGAE